MGQKVNPNIIRLGYIKTWNNIWFSEKNNFSDNLLLDIKIRNFLLKYLNRNILSNIKIEHYSNIVKILIFTSKPGIIIGKGGSDIDNIKLNLSRLLKININVSIFETPNSNTNAQLISNNIALSLTKRVMFKKVIKRYIYLLEKLNIKGIKIRIKGRINGAEIARTEWVRIGRIPLHTFRADIDYGFSTALTTYGIIGIKVWIFNGEVFK